MKKIKKLVAAALSVFMIGTAAVNFTACGGMELPPEIAQILSGLSENTIIKGIIDGNAVEIFLEAATAKFYAYLSESEEPETAVTCIRSAVKPEGTPLYEGTFANQKSSETTESTVHFVVTKKEGAELSTDDIFYFSAPVDFTSENPHFTEEDSSEKVTGQQAQEKFNEEQTTVENQEKEGTVTTPEQDSEESKKNYYDVAEEKLKTTQVSITTNSDGNVVINYYIQSETAETPVDYIFVYNAKTNHFDASANVPSWLANAVKDYENFTGNDNTYPNLQRICDYFTENTKQAAQIYIDNEFEGLFEILQAANDKIQIWCVNETDENQNGHSYLNIQSEINADGTIKIIFPKIEEEEDKVTFESFTLGVKKTDTSIEFIEDTTENGLFLKLSAALKKLNELAELAVKINDFESVEEFMNSYLADTPILQAFLEELSYSSKDETSEEKQQFNVYKGTVNINTGTVALTDTTPQTCPSLDRLYALYSPNEYVLYVVKQEGTSIELVGLLSEQTTFADTTIIVAVQIVNTGIGDVTIS